MKKNFKKNTHLDRERMRAKEWYLICIAYTKAIHRNSQFNKITTKREEKKSVLWTTKYWKMLATQLVLLIAFKYLNMFCCCCCCYLLLIQCLFSSHHTNDQFGFFTFKFYANIRIWKCFEIQSENGGILMPETFFVYYQFN